MTTMSKKKQVRISEDTALQFRALSSEQMITLVVDYESRSKHQIKLNRIIT